MNSDRIREIQEQTAYPESRSVAQALVQVWHEVGAELESVRTERDALRVMLRRSNEEVKRRHRRPLERWVRPRTEHKE